MLYLILHQILFFKLCITMNQIINYIYNLEMQKNFLQIHIHHNLMIIKTFLPVQFLLKIKNITMLQYLIMIQV